MLTERRGLITFRFTAVFLTSSRNESSLTTRELSLSRHEEHAIEEDKQEESELSRKDEFTCFALIRGF